MLVSSPGGGGVAIEWAAAPGGEVGYSRYIGRVGALAVALGVGMAVSTSYGIAPAAATPANGNSASAESETDADGNDGGVDGDDGVEGGEGLRGETAAVSISAQTTGGDEDDVDALDEVGVLDEDDAEGGGDDTEGADDETVVDTEEAETEAVTEEAPSAEPTTAPPVESVSGGDAQDASSASEAAGVEVSEPLSTIESTVVADDDTVVADEDPVDADVEVSVVVDAPVVTAGEPAVTADEPASTVVRVGARDPISALLAIPAALVSATVDLVVGFFEPIVGPGAPLENAMLWGMLAWVRRQTSQTLSNDTPAVEDSRQVTLVLNPGQVSAPVEFGGVDGDGDALRYSVPASGQPGGPAHGTISIDQASGTWTYTPGPGWDGASVLTDEFTVTVSDVGSGFHIHGLSSLLSGSGGHASTSTVRIEVTPANMAPVAVDDAYDTTEDSVLTVAGPGVLGNDSDPEGEPLTATLDTGPSHGTVDLNADGSFTYTPDADYHGADSFSYTVSDGTDTDTATVSITVTPVNDLPEAVGDTYSVAEDSVLTVAGPGVLGNDSDPEGEPLTATLDTGPSHGTVDLNADGSFTYTPDADYNGADSFSYTVSDGTASDTATVSIAVVSVNDAPVANPDTLVADENEPLTFNATELTGNDTDVDGDALTVESFTQPGHGTVTDNGDGTFTYTPDEGYSGLDSFSYTVSDGAATDAATVTVNIGAANTAPVFDPDAVTRELQDPSTGEVTGSLGVTDPDGDTLTYTVVAGPTMGSVEIDPTTNTYTYTPTQAAQLQSASASRVDSFTVEVSDGINAPVTFTVDNIDIAPEKIHIGPVLDLQLSPFAQVVVGPDGRGYVLDVPSGSSGTVYEISPDGTVEVLHEFDTFGGQNTFSSGHAVSPDGERLYVLVNPPEADESGQFIGTGLVHVIDTTSGDHLGSIPVGDTGELAVSIAIASDGSFAVASGAATLNPDGTPSDLAGKITRFDASGAVIGDPLVFDDLPLLVSVSPDGSRVYYASFGLGPANQVVSYVSSVWDTATGVNTDFLENDLWAILTAAGLPSPHPDGKQLYTTVAIEDNSGVGQPKLAVIDVDPASPTYLDVIHEFSTDEFYGFGPSGVVTFSPDGSVAFAPVVDEDFAGMAFVDTAHRSVFYVAVPGARDDQSVLVMSGDGVHGYLLNLNTADDAGAVSIVTIVPTEVPFNAAPVAVGDVYSTPEDQALTFSATSLTANDSDTDGDALSVASFTQPGHGTLTNNGDGTFTYTPDADYNGPDSFTYTVSDGTATSVPAMVTITVTPVNDAPVANGDSLLAAEDESLTFSATELTGNDSDTDGDALSVASLTQPGHGTLSDNGDGTFTYTPDEGYSGPDSFSYTVSDGTASSAPATVSINVVDADNSAPIFDPDAVTRELQDPSTGVVTGSLGVTDPDGDTITYNIVTGPGMGTVEIDPVAGTYTYTPTQAAQFKAAIAPEGLVDSFTIEVTDYASVPVTVTVDNIAVAPESIRIDPLIDEPVWPAAPVVAGPDGRGYVVTTSFGEDGSPRTTVYSVNPDGSVTDLTEFDVGQPTTLFRPAHVVSPDGERLYVLVNTTETDEDGQPVEVGSVRIIETASGNDIASIQIGDVGEIGTAIAIASDGTLVVASGTLGDDGSVAVEIRLLDAGGTGFGDPIPVQGIPFTLDVSPDASHVYYFGIDPSGGPATRVVDTATGELIDYLAAAFPGAEVAVGLPTLSPDGKQLFTYVDGFDDDGADVFPMLAVIDTDPASPTFHDVVHKFSPDAFNGFLPIAGEITFSPDSSVAYVVVPGNGSQQFALAAIDTTDYSVLSLAPYSGELYGVAMTGDGVHGYVYSYDPSTFVEAVSIITIAPANEEV
ncbi:tandem-95 repeat protein [Mycolicibacterium pulveris]|nr:tandem-95 repeat protein [Mycolicibacterium pulveris]